MQHIDLLGASEKLADLNSFAEGFFSAIDANGYEERESSNYIGGRYFRAIIDGMDFTVCLSDEDGFDDFPYWIHINTDVDAPNAANLGDVIESIVREKLLTNGFLITRIINIGTYDAEQANYENTRVLSR
jgi:hypothetical protein